MKPQFYSQYMAPNHSFYQFYPAQNRVQNLLLNTYMAQVALTKSLLTNQNALGKYFSQREKSSDYGIGSSNNNGSQSKKSLSNSSEVKIQKLEQEQQKQVQMNESDIITVKLRKKKNTKYIEDSFEGEKRNTPKKFCQTKNMIKNFAKSIFNYIKKDIGLRKKIISSLGIVEDEFNKNVAQLKENIHSIAQIRALWTTNKFSKAYRIFSQLYIKKHSLKHIFNSRISNHQIHYKYREKLLRSLRNPQEFTSIKDF